MGDEAMDASGVEALSKLPSREELIATVVARLTGQASQIAQRVTLANSVVAFAGTVGSSA